MSTCPTCGAQYPHTVRICTRDGTVLEAPVPLEAHLVGKTLEGKYRLDAFLSGGGMGAVYKATHVMLGKTVAVKVIKPELVTSPEIVRRFQREARAATSLNHPNIVGVFDLGQTEDGTLYLAMEFIEGTSLKEVIRRSGPLEARRIVHLLLQVAGALALAHRHNIVHRDLKPHNIMLTTGETGDEVAKLVDFGIAKTFDDAATQLTRTGYALGTPQYMSPEQALGKEVDGRSDLYSLGVILYEMLTGEVPFSDESAPAILVKHMNEAPVPPSARRPDVAVNPELEAIALRCLEKDPARRFQRAEEVAEALRAAVGIAAPAAEATVPLARAASPSAQPTEVLQPAVGARTPSPAAGGTAAPAEPASRAPMPAGGGATPATAQAPAAAAAAAAEVARPAPSRHRGVPALVLAVVVAGVAVVAGAAWLVARWGPFGARPIEEAQTPAGVTSPEMALVPAASPAMAEPPPAAPTGGAARGQTPAPPGTTQVGSVPRGSAGQPGRPLATELQGAPGAPVPQPTSAQPVPPALPERPAIFSQCSGAAEVCSAVGAALDKALAGGGLPRAASAARADVVVGIDVSVVDERVTTQFGTTFVVRTYAIAASGAAPRFEEAVPMPAPATFSFDAQFGRERAAEQARLIAAGVVERVQAYWSGKRQQI